jgi:hypothetical protein
MEFNLVRALFSEATEGTGLLDLVSFTPTLARAPELVEGPLVSGGYAGGPARLQILATSSQPIRYQWLHEGVPVAGATTARLTLDPLSPADAGRYSVVLSNPYGAITSSIVSLAVTSAPAPRLSGAGHPDVEGFGLQWITVPGWTYDVEFSGDLEHWLPWTTLEADDELTTLMDPSPEDTRRFYRVRAR